MNNRKYQLLGKKPNLIICVVLFNFLLVAIASGTTRNPIADFDGDGKTDISVFRPSNGYWYISKSSGGYSFLQWGISTDMPVPGDYDGDGKTDLAVYRQDVAGENFWHILRSSDNSYVGKSWGRDSGFYVDIPIPADYDGDGKTDLAIHNVSDIVGAPSRFRILRSATDSTDRIDRGSSSDTIVQQTDYDGDGKADLTFVRSGTWFIAQTSSGTTRIESFGLFSDKYVPADYDGDGRADLAVWRPSNGYWYWLSSRDKSFNSIQFGLSDDKPVPSDYDGDGKTDVAVFRPSSGVWYIQQSTKGFRAEQFGLSDDIPIPNVFVR